MVSCDNNKKKFVPSPKYHDSVYLKTDSNIAIIKFFGIIKSKDTTYFYGIEQDSCGVIVRKIIYDKDIIDMIK